MVGNEGEQCCEFSTFSLSDTINFSSFCFLEYTKRSLQKKNQVKWVTITTWERAKVQS